jgi:nitrogen fixation/metabolism regulation signal transduction histidine kinase
MNRRRKYFIEKKFQGQFIMRFCAIVVLSSVAVGVLLFLLSMNSTTVAIENTRVVVKNTADFILPMIIITLLMVTAFSAACIAILLLITTHKIVGPIYRMKIDAVKLADGDLTVDFRVRTDDQLKDLAWSMTEAAASLRERVKVLKTEIDNVMPQIERAPNKESAVKIKKTLDYFKI